MGDWPKIKKGKKGEQKRFGEWIRNGIGSANDVRRSCPYLKAAFFFSLPFLFPVTHESNREQAQDHSWTPDPLFFAFLWSAYIALSYYPHG